jgi:NAD(P)-dependent dehydrogenase (short-subunit alcohol dehydrogenase family)
VSGPRAALVTGATGGLGGAVVRRLLQAGARVAFPYRRDAAWRELQAAAGVNAPLFGIPAADLSDAATAAQLVASARERLGELDSVALLAGAWAGGSPFHEAPPDEWSRLLRVNLDSAAHVCRAAIPLLRERGGAIVAVGSRAAEAGGAGMAAYAVAKTALHALVRVLAQENRAHGVRVNAVLPGTIDTAANREAMRSADRSGWTSPDRIAEVIVFLLSSESAATTGALVPVDGAG